MKSPKTILVVDDNAGDLKLTTLALARPDSPYRVQVAHDGVEALEYLQCRGPFESRAPGNPDVVLLDIKMPRMDGLEALRTIKSDPRWKMIPVIMFTSSSETEDILKSYQWGANAYVAKPVDFQEFLNAVREIEVFWAAINESPPGHRAPTDSSKTSVVTLA